MNREFEALEILKNKALSDLDSVPKTAMPMCEKSNEEAIEAYEILKQALLELKTIKETDPIEALENLKIPLHNEWLRFYPQFKEMGETTKIVDGCRMVKSDAYNYLTIKQYVFKTQKDLDRLKILEKENQELIKKADCCMWKDCNKISQENQELKDKLNLGNALCSGFWYDNKQVVLCTLEHYDDIMTENMRLKKAIKRAIELLSINEKILNSK